MKLSDKPFAGSGHFRMERVAEGVYAALAVPGTGSLANAAIVDLGDATLVVDTFTSIEAAADLRAAAEQLTGRAVSYVFNTHWHADHTFGNQVFAPEARFIATSKTRGIMDGFLRSRTADHLAQADEVLRSIDECEARMREETDEKLRKELEWEARSDRTYMRTLPELKLTLPSLTFDRQLTVHGSKRTAELLTFGGGHTQSDAILYIPEEKLAVTGDLVLSRHHLVLRYANLQEWLHILDRIEELGVETIVPGHGPASTLEELRQARGYLTDMLKLAEDISQNRMAAGEVPVPEAYRDWYFTGEFRPNLQALVDRISGGFEQG